jgi:flagellar motor switch protein FliN/FliY
VAVFNPSAWLTQEWGSKLASSVEMMTEKRPVITLGSRTELPDVPADALWYSIPLNLSPDSAVFIGAAPESWQRIAKSALLAAGVGDSEEAEARATYLEIIGQATSGLAQAIADRLDRSVDAAPAQPAAPSGLAGIVFLDITLPEPWTGRLYLGWTAALERELAPPPVDNSPSPAAVVKRPPVEGSRTLDLLMEVELPVSVSFGRAEIQLRDALKLNSGSIVELNRTIADPVEIIVNNCVIARGEVVVVDGNYGVRIHQVVSREERLRTLK